MKVSFKYGSNGDIAFKNLNEARIAFKGGGYKGTGFWCQQAVECIIKEYIREKYDNASESLLRSHSLTQLAYSDTYLSSLDGIAGFGLLQAVYFNTRYEGDEYWELNEITAKKALDCAEAAIQQVCDLIYTERKSAEVKAKAELDELKFK